MGQHHRHAFPLLGALLLCFSLTGCGSSDLEQVIITAQNAEALGAEALDAADFLEGMGDLVEEWSVVFESEDDARIPCDSGSIETILVDAGPPGVLSAGDSATITFHACVVNSAFFPVTFNGTVSLTVLEASLGAEGVFSRTVTASFQSLSMVTLGTTVVVNGAFTHSFSSPDGETLHSLITGDSMSAFIAAGNGASWSGTAQDFRVEREYDTESGSYLWDLDLTVSGSRIPGRIIFDTTLPFTGGEGDPSSGVLVITGAEGATATIVAIDDIQVQILVDLDGGGGTDITINTTWDVLRDD